jgi:hypothetical protein
LFTSKIFPGSGRFNRSKNKGLVWAKKSFFF